MGEYANLLTVPDELALLLHKPSGTSFVGASPGAATAAAEVGELVLHGRLALRGTAVQLRDASSSGLPWLDQLMAQLQRVAGRDDRPVQLGWWLPLRSGAFATHRSVLVERGVLRLERRKFLGVLPDDRYHPDRATRDALLAELHGLAQGELPVDGRRALLGALVHRSGLDHALDLDRAERARLRALADRADLDDHVGSAVLAAELAMAVTPNAIVLADH